MGRTVRELLPGLSERELAEWTAFDLVEPIGGRRGDYQAAIVASTVVNVNRRKGGKVAKVSDFVPEYGRPAREMSLDDWLARRMAEQPHLDTEAQRDGGTAEDGKGLDGVDGVNDAGGEAAGAGDGAGGVVDDERLRGGGDDLVERGDGVGGAAAAAGGDA
jgi:hypothetical protein